MPDSKPSDLISESHTASVTVTKSGSNWSVSGGITIAPGQLVMAGAESEPTHATRDPALPDTPDDQIKWESMTALIEYYEDIDLNAAGYRWFCTTSGVLVSTDPDDPTKNVWHYYYKAAPYVRVSPPTSRTDKSRTIQQGGFADMKSAQEAAVRAMRSYQP